MTKVLLTKEALNQTIRFALSGAFTTSEESLTTRLITIHKQCPTLLDALLPSSEKVEDEHNDSRLAVADDAVHERPIGMGCLQRTYVQNQLGWTLSPGRLHYRDPFAVMLREAYDIDFGEPNVTLAPTHGIQWCQKLAFTDR